MHVINENYHVYNRGAHKAPIFLDTHDYLRFVFLLHIANDTRPLERNWASKDIWSAQEKNRLVSIFAYCLMPNHFHIGIQEICELGITRFMNRICTAYAMYYNKKYDHSGTIFQGPYKSKHVGSDEYLRYLIQYIHLNPFGIEEPDLMKSARPEFLDRAIAICREYEYSSFKDYLDVRRPQNVILCRIAEVSPV